VAEYPALNKGDLSRFSGRPTAAYGNAGALRTAITQATLLFKIATCRSDFPDNEQDAELATMAIAAYADHIYLRLPFAKAEASPFSSESLGSYSYSKSASAAAKGDKTGIMWFDLAVDRLSQCDISDGVPTHGGVEIFEHDAPMVRSGESGLRMLSPQDLSYHEAHVHDPLPNGVY